MVPEAKARIEVLCGCMFAGKTARLIEKTDRAGIAGKRIQVFKVAPDGPDGLQVLRSYSGLSRSATFVRDTSDIQRAVAEFVDYVAIDEAQFLDDEAVEFILNLANSGIDVLLSGLDLDFAGRPFGPMPTFMAIADVLTKLSAVCMLCSAPATRTQRLYGPAPAKVSDPLIVHGGHDRYEARCRSCHVVRA